ncbi:7360_t:CDS:2, partial [Acaulospora colombiana]
ILNPTASSVNANSSSRPVTSVIASSPASSLHEGSRKKGTNPTITIVAVILSGHHSSYRKKEEAKDRHTHNRVWDKTTSTLRSEQAQSHGPPPSQTTRPNRKPNRLSGRSAQHYTIITV